jgi:hypothetical protein
MAENKLRPEDRGTEKDPLAGAYQRRFEEAQKRDPKGVAAWLKQHAAKFRGSND